MDSKIILKDWQKKVVSILENDDDKIYWFYSNKAVGKTFLFNYLMNFGLQERDKYEDVIFSTRKEFVKNKYNNMLNKCFIKPKAIFLNLFENNEDNLNVSDLKKYNIKIIVLTQNPPEENKDVEIIKTEIN